MVSGGGSNLQSIIDGIADGRIQNGRIAAVISDTPGAYALKRAEHAGIDAILLDKKSFPDRKSFNQKLSETIDGYKPDLIVLAGYLSIIAKSLTERYENRIINIHPALIPAFCGKGFYGHRVHDAVIAAGVKESGATVHYVDGGVDTGPIIIRETVPVPDGDTAETLAERVLKVEHKIIVQAVNKVLNEG